MSDLPTKHEDTEETELGYEELKPSDMYKGNNMLSNMASRSALGAAQAQKRKEGKSPRLSTID